MTADDAVGEEKWDIAVGLYDCDNCVIRNNMIDGSRVFEVNSSDNKIYDNQ